MSSTRRSNGIAHVFNPGQPADGDSILFGDGHKFRGGVCQFADLAVVRFDRLQQELDSFVYRHAEFILRHSNRSGAALFFDFFFAVTALFVELTAARRKVECQLEKLADIEAMVVSDPEIMRGIPVFKGTRIPVDLVADMLAQGATTDEILEGYPTLSKEIIAVAPLYMRAFPRRGRPGHRAWQGKKAMGCKSFPLSALLKNS